MKHDIVLMAKSKKGNEGYCIAGIDVETGSWIRLNMQGCYSIPRSSFKYPDGCEPKLLDTISVEIIGRDNGLAFQPENFFCDIRGLTKSSSENNEDVVERLNKDKRYGEVLYDNLPYVEVSMLRSYQGDYHSLMIIEPENFHFIKQREGKFNAYFSYKGIDYRAFRITDLDFIEAHESCTQGKYYYTKEDYLLVISMGVPFFNDHSGVEECWKLVAAVIDKAGIITEEKQTKEEAESCNNTLDTSNKNLYRQLTNLRMDLAQKEGLPAYCIFHNKTLVEMCKKLPMNENEMLKIFGVGKRSLQKYGDSFLAEIKDFIISNDIDTSANNEKNQLSLTKLIETIEEGIDPVTGEVYGQEELIKNDEFKAAIKRLYAKYVKPKTEKPERAGQPWDDAEDETLEKEFLEGMSIGELSKMHGRTRGSITARLTKKGLLK